VLAMLEARARIYSRKYLDGAVELEVDAPESVVRRMQGFVVPEFDPVEIPGEPMSEAIKRDRRR
jgi:hypothetical protein